MKRVEETAREPVCTRCDATTYDECAYPERCGGISGRTADGKWYPVERTPEQAEANKDRIYLDYMTVREFEAEVAEAVAAAVKARDEEHATAHREALARAEKAEAERDTLKASFDGHVYVPDADYVELVEGKKKAEAERDAALATARNRALEEAAECVKDCRQWEPECPHAARILSLRTKEPGHE